MIRQLVLLAFLIVPPLAPVAQVPPRPPQVSKPGWPDALEPPPTPEEARRQKEMKKAQSRQRYKDLRKDTDKLLSLATELKRQVDAAGENTLSLEVIRKAEQIEKLARSVKKKMSGD